MLRQKSFDKNDVLQWGQNEPAFGRQAVYLHDVNTVADLPRPSGAELAARHALGCT